MASAQNASPQTIPAPPVFDLRNFDEHVRPFLEKHCVSCHGPQTVEAKLRLDTLAADFLNRPTVDQWVEVLDRLNLGEMPPPDEPRPVDEELTRVTDWITAELKHTRTAAQSTGGRAVLRRLTRHEYSNTVRDLLGVEFVEGQSPREQLPPDGALAGFDRTGKGLFLDPSLMDAYLTVAQQVVDRAIVFRPPTVPQRTMRFEFERTANTGAIAYLLDHRGAEVDGEFLVMMDSAARTYGKLLHPYNDKEIPVTGRYRIRIRAAADRGARAEPVYMDVTYSAAGRQARFRVDAKKDAPQVYEFEKTFDVFIPGEFAVSFVNSTRFQQGNDEWYQGNSQLTRLAEAGQTLESMRIKARMRAEGAYDSYARSSYLPGVLHTQTLPKLYLDWIELEGPLQGDYPARSRQIVFGNEETATRFATRSTGHEQLLADTRQILARLLPRAFRRPVKQAEVEAIVNLVEAELKAGESPQQGIKTGLVAMLCSADFLFLFEPSGKEDSPRPLTDHEFATRLSYFLWSSLPDAELTHLAATNRLRSPDVLAAQIDRMLADPKIEGFIDGFARQWLKVDEFRRFRPDEEIYPEYYATDMVGIEQDVQQEALAFFREVLLRDEPITSFLDSDWLMLNERLAKLYGITGVAGPELRRVPLARTSNAPAAHRRGGLLGMAGVHLWGADGNRTKPVERGKYLLTVLFNDPPDPPPPNAGEVEPNLRGEVLSIRQRLARHREQTTCNHCHRRIDPYGLALENFNAIGQWRDHLDGERPLWQWGQRHRPLIDASGKLPNGIDFADFITFKQAILQQHSRLARALAEKLFLFATGRVPEPADRATIDRIASADSPAMSLRMMLHNVITSAPFGAK